MFLVGTCPEHDIWRLSITYYLGAAHPSFLLTLYVKIYDFLAVMIRGVETLGPEEVEVKVVRQSHG